MPGVETCRRPNVQATCTHLVKIKSRLMAALAEVLTTTAPAGKPTLPGDLPRDLRSESTHLKESLGIAHPVVSTGHRRCQTLTAQGFVEIPMPRLRNGRVREERVDLRRQPVHMKMVRAPAKKLCGKAVDGGRDPLISFR